VLSKLVEVLVITMAFPTIADFDLRTIPTTEAGNANIIYIKTSLYNKLKCSGKKTPCF